MINKPLAAAFLLNHKKTQFQLYGTYILFILFLTSCHQSEKTNPPIVKKDTIIQGKLISKEQTFSTIIHQVPQLSIFSTAMDSTQLLQNLQADEQYTFFVPTDSAFYKLKKGALENWMKPAMRYSLDNLLKFHIVKGALNSHDLVPGKTIVTLEGKELLISINLHGDLMVNNANIDGKNIYCTNGVIHLIDAVLIPVKNRNRK